MNEIYRGTPIMAALVWGCLRRLCCAAMADFGSLSTDETIAAELPDGASSVPSKSVLGAGRYAILGLIGRGGMGRVHRAKDQELDEVVALEVLHRNLLGSEGMVQRFRQEVKLARRVTHRNVARTFDIGEHQGERFFTKELIEIVAAYRGPLHP